MLWERYHGPTPTEKTGPETDHTFQYTNNSGHYMFVNMNQHANDGEMKKLVGFASNAVMNSVVFNPPPQVHYNASSPYRNSCMVRNFASKGFVQNLYGHFYPENRFDFMYTNSDRMLAV